MQKFAIFMLKSTNLTYFNTFEIILDGKLGGKKIFGGGDKCPYGATTEIMLHINSTQEVEKLAVHCGKTRISSLLHRGIATIPEVELFVTKKP